MPVVTEHMKWRRSRNQFRHPISGTDSNPQIPSIIQPSHNKSTISSLLSSFPTNTSTTSNETPHDRDQNRNNNNNNNKSNRKFSAATFRGFGCTAGASQQVSVPAVIRSSADWEGKRNRKKKHRRNSNSNSGRTCDGVVDDGSGNSVDFQDVWCGPGIGFSADAAASVDCVVARKNVSTRGKLDVAERVTHRERSSYFGRRTVKPESFSFLDDEPDIFTARPGLEPFGTARFYRHVPHASSDGLAEIMILQGRIMMGGRLNSHDQFRDLRLDVDNMSYEQLLELGERIGYVNTGLKEDEMGLNISRVKLSSTNDASKHQIDKKCSVCQEEYESDDELGRLKCEHSYHFQCIKQWLVHKNFCPVCKQEVVVRH
ncbi:E3 ubiquitin-protein ligase MBR2 [Spatholobus suberectus]|nr:E3 ubiquitin-protein ligase MBR2 [Spatholobus suberectus]